MSKYQWRQRKAKAAERKAKEDKKRHRLAPYIVKAQLCCGCCDTTMHFKSKASARAAFEKAGLTSIGYIVDDLGEMHEGVDTFYGFRGEAEPPRGIGYLMKRLVP